MKLLYIRYSTSDLNTTSQPVSMQEGKSPLFYTVSWRTSVDLVKLSVLVIRKQENTHLQQKTECQQRRRHPATLASEKSLSSVQLPVNCGDV